MEDAYSVEFQLREMKDARQRISDMTVAELDADLREVLQPIQWDRRVMLPDAVALQKFRDYRRSLEKRDDDCGKAGCGCNR